MARKLKVLMIMSYGHPPLPNSSLEFIMKLIKCIQGKFNINVMLHVHVVASYDMTSMPSLVSWSLEQLCWLEIMAMETKGSGIILQRLGSITYTVKISNG